MTYDTATGQVQRIRYYPWGGVRSGDVPTDRRFTGQRWDDTIGLYDYNARYYDPAIGRFIQPDIIVPDPTNPQDLNRYTYAGNNPLRYTDPSGYCIPDECPWVPQVSYPGDYTGPYDKSYDAWLIRSILWLEREWAATGGMLGIREAQQSIATELAHRIMHSDDPAVYIEQLFQGLIGSGPEIAAWAADKGVAFISSFSSWVLSQVQIVGRSGRQFPRFKDLPPQPGMERHHIIEKRFADAIGVKPEDIPADYLPPQEHRGPGSVTTELRRRLPYGRAYTPQEIWDAHKEVYMEKGRYDWIEAIWPYFQALEVKR